MIRSLFGAGESLSRPLDLVWGNGRVSVGVYTVTAESYEPVERSLGCVRQAVYWN